MALEAQGNWDVEMSKPPSLALRQRSYSASEAPTIDLSSNKGTDQSSDKAADLRATTRRPLPVEIVLHIISFLPPRTSQSTLWACSLVSRAWYSASIRRLYQYPHITPNNFAAFVSTICPSKNARIRHTPLSAFVLNLDMSELVHNSSRSLTARLLGRLKGNLVGFAAPQASFAINSFAALSKCVHLKVLNLSLLSTSIDMGQLFHTLAHLENLETLFFPRTSSTSNRRQDQEEQQPPFAWPPKLKTLHLAGGIDDTFLVRQLTLVPQTLEHLSIQHCSQVNEVALVDTLGAIRSHLKHLTILHPMSNLYSSDLNTVLMVCTSLISLRISVDFISRFFFVVIPKSHPLQSLDLDCSSAAGSEVGIDPDVIFLAVEDGKLDNLRSVRVNARLAWTASKRVRRDAAELGEILEAAERERPLGVETGVWVYSD